MTRFLLSLGLSFLIITCSFWFYNARSILDALALEFVFFLALLPWSIGILLVVVVAMYKLLGWLAFCYEGSTVAGRARLHARAIELQRTKEYCDSLPYVEETTNEKILRELKQIRREQRDLLDPPQGLLDDLSRRMDDANRD